MHSVFELVDQLFWRKHVALKGLVEWCKLARLLIDRAHANLLQVQQALQDEMDESGVYILLDVGVLLVVVSD